jgi:hypothetical protein
VASFVCQAAELPPPRELMPVMAVLAATDMPSDPGEAVTRAGLAAGGALVAWLLTMAPALAGGWRVPERAAVASALEAVAGLLDAVTSTQVDAARHAAVTGVRQARTARVAVAASRRCRRGRGCTGSSLRGCAASRSCCPPPRGSGSG